MRYYASRVSPTPDCITRKFREFISGNSSSSLDIFLIDVWYEIGVRRLVFRLFTVGFIVVLLCLKESLAMPTRGRFVCHVHCPVHDGAVRSSPSRPHHENFGRNLYHMFVLAYSASQSFCFCFELWYSSCFNVKCWFHTFPKWSSHTTMWIPILHVNRDCLVNPFQPMCFSSSGSDHFQHAQDQL